MGLLLASGVLAQFRTRSSFIAAAGFSLMFQVAGSVESDLVGVLVSMREIGLILLLLMPLCVLARSAKHITLVAAETRGSRHTQDPIPNLVSQTVVARS